MTLDVRTLFLVVGLLALLEILIMVMLWLANRRMPGLGAWTLSTFCNASSSPLFMLQDAIPGKFFTFFLPTMLTGLATVLFHIGVCRFTESKLWKRTLILANGIGLPLYLYYLFIEEHLGIRIQVTTMVSGMIYAVTAIVLWKQKMVELRLSTRFAAICCWIIVFMCCYRIFAWWLNPQVDWNIGSQTQSIVMPLTIIIMLFLWTFCFIFMVNQRQTREISLNMKARHEAEQSLLEARAEVERQRSLRMRQMMARDLHDGIGGITATVAMLASLGKEEDDAREKEELIARIEKMAQEGSREIRDLMGSLEKGVISWAEWLADVRNYATKTCSATGVELHWQISGEPPEGVIKDHPAATSLMRAMMEALNNVVRHADATEAHLTISFNADEVRIALQDNGKGYQGPRIGGRGIKNMNRRIQEMGGVFTMSTPSIAGMHENVGTQLQMTIPLPLKLI